MAFFGFHSVEHAPNPWRSGRSRRQFKSKHNAQQGIQNKQYIYDSDTRKRLTFAERNYASSRPSQTAFVNANPNMRQRRRQHKNHHRQVSTLMTTEEFYSNDDDDHINNIPLTEQIIYETRQSNDNRGKNQYSPHKKNAIYYTTDQIDQTHSRDKENISTGSLLKLIQEARQEQDELVDIVTDFLDMQQQQQSSTASSHSPPPPVVSTEQIKELISSALNDHAKQQEQSNQDIKTAHDELYKQIQWLRQNSSTDAVSSKLIELDQIKQQLQRYTNQVKNHLEQTQSINLTENDQKDKQKKTTTTIKTNDSLGDSDDIKNKTPGEITARMLSKLSVINQLYNDIKQLRSTVSGIQISSEWIYATAQRDLLFFEHPYTDMNYRGTVKQGQTILVLNNQTQSGNGDVFVQFKHAHYQNKKLWLRIIHKDNPSEENALTDYRFVP